MSALELTRSQRRRKLGIECPDRVVWKSWEVGEEHTRKIVIKNIEGRAQVITFTLPENRTTFLTPFPEPVTLNSGVSYELVVRFCPTEPVEIHDQIEIQVKGRGSFAVALDCLTPFARLTCAPQTLDFGFAAVRCTVENEAAPVSMTNTGTVPIDFYWEVPAPFALHPSHGHLEIGESVALRVLFCPMEACAVLCQAVCKMSELDEIIGTLKLSGVGKYPFVRLATPEDPVLAAVLPRKQNPRKAKGGKSAAFTAAMEQYTATSAVIDFGDVPAGCIATHEFVVENPSPVPTQVRMHNCDAAEVGGAGDTTHGIASPSDTQEGGLIGSSGSGSGSSPFTFHPVTATLPPGGQHTFRATFKARCVASMNNVAYELRSATGNAIRLAVKGAVTGPRLAVSTSYLDYGDVDLQSIAPPPPEFTMTTATRTGAMAPAEAPRALVKYVALTNTSGTVPCHFEFPGLSAGAAFCVEPSSGTVAPKQSLRVRVTFRPSEPAHYLRRLFLLVQDSQEMMYVDAFGTAYDGDNRPPPMSLADVDAFNANMEAANEAAAGGAAAGAAGPRRRAAGRLPYAAAAAQLSMLRPDDDDRVAVAALTEARPFTLDAKVVAFPMGGNGGDGGGAVWAQFVTVCNAAAEDATATWAVPRDSPFTVKPPQLVVPANGTAQFQVLLTRRPEPDHINNGGGAGGGGGSGTSPPVPEQAQFLECYVNYRSMSSFRLARDDVMVTPPHCLVLQCRRSGGPVGGAGPAAGMYRMSGESGVSGGGGRNSRCGAIAELHVSCSERVVRFPPCGVGSTAFQAVSLINDSDVARVFEFRGVTIKGVVEKVHSDMTALDADGNVDDRNTGTMAASEHGDGVGSSGLSAASTFSCYPVTGVLAPRRRALLLLRFRPTCQARYDAEALIHILSPASLTPVALPIALVGETAMPRLELLTSPQEVGGGSDGGQPTVLVFPPACITGEISSTVWLRNPYPIPVEFRLLPSNEMAGVMRFEPEEGVVPAGARLPVAAFFAPEEVRRYEGSVVLITRNAVSADYMEAGPAPQEYLVAWPAVGEGMRGIVEVEPTELNCGEVSGMEPQTVAITLYNSGLCAVGYEMRVLTCTEPAEWHHAATPPTLRNSAGTIPPRSHKVVLATVHPAAAGLSEYIVYVMIAGIGTDISRVASPRTIEETEQHPHCRISIRGTRPTVQVGDVRSLSQMRSHLWKQLSIAELNEQLAVAVQPKDVATDTYAFHQFADGLVPVTMQLAVGPQHSMPSVTVVVLRNVADCAADFSLWLPTESSVTGESWFLEDEALKNVQAVLDRRIIDISPCSGSIPAGGSVALTLVYRFSEVGLHSLPVVLRIADGRRALLSLEGRTVPPGMACLSNHQAVDEYELMPVALGDVEPPMQSIMVLDNPLDIPVTYAVDQQALRDLAEANYGFPILQCANPTGVLPPRSMAELHWYFRPLEARQYTMNVPVTTSSGSSAEQDSWGSTDSVMTGESYTFTFTGLGYHPRRTPAADVQAMIESSFLDIPTAAPSLPSLPISLAPEVLPLGALPYFSLHRMCCTLVNTHPTDTYSFEWDVRHEFGDHLLTVQPMRGRLAPNGGRVDCRLGFYSGSTSQLLRWPVPCRLVNETAVELEMSSDGNRDRERGCEDSGCISDDASEYFAVDGKGLQQYQADQAAKAPTARAAPFERATCCKATQLRLQKQQLARAGAQRAAVTDLPVELLGARALSRRVQNARSGEVAVQGTEAAVSAVVELLIQARVMPVEDYERTYGRARQLSTHQPLVAMFQDPTDLAAPATATFDEAAVVTGIMDELARTVVAQPSVRAAITEPRRNDTVYYHEIRRSLRRAHPTQQDAQAEAAATAHSGAGVLAGLVGNVVEEAIEELVFQAVAEGCADVCA